MSDIRIQKAGEPDILQTSDGRLALSVPIQIKRRSGRKLVTLPNGLAQHAFEVLEHQEQVVRVSRAGLEFPRLVPLPRRIVLGMDQQTANAGDVGRPFITLDGAVSGSTLPTARL